MKVAIACADRLRQVALRRAVASEPGHPLAWLAGDPADVLRRARADRPDLLLLDLEVGGDGGADLVRRLMETSPCVIVLVAAERPDALGPAEIRRVYEAMGGGALDVVTAPVVDAAGELRGGAALAAKLRTAERLVGPAAAPDPAPGAESAAPLLVAIGASTGGPQAVAAVLGRLPRDLPAALVVVQHIEDAYAPGLASWLAEKTGFPVRLARAGMSVQVGEALLASSASRLELAGGLFRAAGGDAAEDRAIDLLFRSLVASSTPGCAMLLTGMGRDGAAGLLELRRAGWTTIAQDECSSVVHGMPRAAAEIGAAAQVLPIEAIGPTIAAAVARLGR